MKHKQKKFTAPWLPDVLREVADWLEEDESRSATKIVIRMGTDVENEQVTAIVTYIDDHDYQ